MSTDYHIPVLLNETIEALNIKSDGIYIDITFGGGGHSKEILSKLITGKLIAFDQDTEAEENAQKLADELKNDNKFLFVKSNFGYIKNFLTYYNINKVDGILADLGVSSHQFDTAERGFSYRFEGDLDMRMNQKSSLTANKVLNTYSKESLLKIFRNFGEIKSAFKLANVIVNQRETKEILTVDDLKEAVKSITPKHGEFKFWAKIFQALRIEVNHEMEALTDFLKSSSEIIKTDGRLVVITYHSLEDRPVKNYIKTGNVEGEQKKDFYGNIKAPFYQVNRKVIIPSDAEIEQNNRARSAKLRIAERLEDNERI